MKKYLSILFVSLMFFMVGPNYVSAQNTVQGQSEEQVNLETPTFTISNSYYTSLKLSWTHNDWMITGYKIYRATSKSGKYSYIATVKASDVELGETLTYNDTKKTFNKTYYYKIRPYHKAEDGTTYNGSYSAIKSKKVVTPSPIATGTYTSFLKNKITWKKVTGASGYEVYKLVNGKYVLQKTTTSLSYTETLKNSTTKLQLSNSYKVRAYRKVSGKKIYGPYSSVITVENELSIPKLTYTSIDHTSYKITGNSIAGSTGYELYSCADETCAEEGRTLVVSETKLDEIINVSSMATKQYYVVRAVRTINSESIYSDFSPVYTYSAIPAKLDITNKDIFDKTVLNKTTTAFMIINYDPTVKYEVLRSTSKTGVYSNKDSIICKAVVDYVIDYTIELTQEAGETLTEEQIAQFRSEILDQNPEYEFSYYCEDTKLTTGKTYYYKFRTIKTENESDYYSDYSEVVALKVKPMQVGYVETSPYKYNSTIVEWNSYHSDIDGFEVYRATSKNGKYTKVKTTTKDSYIHTGTLNKKYYYKVRAYYLDSKGNKVYGSFSPVASRTIKPLTAYDSFPIEFNSNNTTSIVKGITISKKSTIGSKVIYNFKFNFSETWASSKQKVYYTAYFYDKDYNYLASAEFTHTISKGSKRNYSVTFEVRVPKEAVYYEFR